MGPASKTPGNIVPPPPHTLASQRSCGVRAQGRHEEIEIKGRMKKKLDKSRPDFDGLIKTFNDFISLIATFVITLIYADLRLHLIFFSFFKSYYRLFNSRM